MPLADKGANAYDSGMDFVKYHLRVFLTFARNSLVRDMTFRANFLIECASTLTWTLMDLGLYLLIYRFVQDIAGWGKYEFFIFLATGKFINAIVQTFFMPNCEEVSELIRTGGLDFALLRPIDTQFLISLRKIEWSSLAHVFVAVALLVVGMWHLGQRPENPVHVTPMLVGLYLLYVGCGIGILYSLMISLAATSIWLGQNRSLYDFWFYITNFSRYPMEIYEGPWGLPLRWVCTFMLPVLLVINVPASLMAQPFASGGTPAVTLFIVVFTLVATVGSLVGSRLIFSAALRSYRSASS